MASYNLWLFTMVYDTRDQPFSSWKTQETDYFVDELEPAQTENNNTVRMNEVENNQDLSKFQYKIMGEDEENMTSPRINFISIKNSNSLLFKSLILQNK